MNRLRGIVCALAAVAAMRWSAPARIGAAQAGHHRRPCDRTGPTQVNGIAICPGIHDYYELMNSKGGVEGCKIKSHEIDNDTRYRPGSRPTRWRRRKVPCPSWSKARRRFKR